MNMLSKHAVPVIQVSYLAVNFSVSSCLQLFFQSCNFCRLLINCFRQLIVLFFQQINLSETTNYVINITHIAILTEISDKRWDFTYLTISRNLLLLFIIKITIIIIATAFCSMQCSKSYPVSSSSLAIRSSFTMFNAFLPNTDTHITVHCKKRKNSLQ